MSHYITTHNQDGKAVFSDKVPTPRHKIGIPGGNMEIILTSHSAKPNLSTESDIDRYADERVNGLPNHALTPDIGVSACVIEMPPNESSLVHRTMTLDCIVVIQGDIEVHLDSGEVRILHTGDSIVQRATMHKWTNVTPLKGIVKLACFLQSAASPLEIAGKRLDVEWHG